MKVAAVLLLPLLCSAAELPGPIASAIDMARAAPGEFAADGFIRIAALEQVEKPRKIALLEQAFRRAGEAQEPYKRHSSITKVQGSGGFYNRAYDQDLDGLSLRLRAVEAMLPLDTGKARELFLQIAPPNPPKLKCDEFLVYDVSRYYDVLADIAHHAFTPKEVEKGEPFRLLLQHAGTIHSPVQVIPMARAILHSGVKDGDFQALVAAYASALGQISGDDRSFTYTRSTGSEIFELVEELKKRGLSPLPLLESYRLYLVTNLSGERCADDELMQTGGQSFGLIDAKAVANTNDVQYFNEALRLPPLQLIQNDEVNASKVEGAATGLRTCDDSECQSIAQEYRKLMFQDSGLAWPKADRKGDEWQNRLRDFLNVLASWHEADGGNAAQFYRNKSGIYADLLNLVPTPENQETVLRALLGFTQRNKFQTESRIQWFLPVNGLLGRAALDPRGIGKLMDEFRHANDPVIALYVQLETVAPRTPDRIMPLL